MNLIKILQDYCRVIIYSLILFIYSGCYQDVINIDLSNIDRQIVIIGKIIEGSRNNYVTINRVGSLTIENDFLPVSNAQITLSDDLGNMESLDEVSPGNYKTNSIVGVPGREYTLLINVDSKEYFAVSTMPLAIELDTIFTYKTSEYNNTHFLSLTFLDDENRSDYAMIRIYINNSLNEIYFYNDEYHNGEQVTLDKDNFNSRFYPQQNIIVEVISLDVSTYRYYTLLFNEDEITGDSGNGSEVDVSDLISSANFNPNNNFSNNALGYFSAQAITVYRLIAQ